MPLHHSGPTQRKKQGRAKPLEKISFKIEPDDDREVVMVTPHRKRSLVDLSPSTKPNLLLTTNLNAPQQHRKIPTVIENMTFQVDSNAIASPTRTDNTSEDEESLVVTSSPRAKPTNRLGVVENLTFQVNSDAIPSPIGPENLSETEDSLVVCSSPRSKLKLGSAVQRSCSPKRSSTPIKCVSRHRTPMKEDLIKVTIHNEEKSHISLSAADMTRSPVGKVRSQAIRSRSVTPEPVHDVRMVQVKTEVEKKPEGSRDVSSFELPKGPQLDNLRKSLVRQGSHC